MTQPDHGHMRASAAERERAVDVLKAAFAEGRLDQDEYTDRVGRVQGSKTYGDLAGLTRGLPIGPFAGLPPSPAAALAPPYPGYPPVVPYRGYPPALARSPSVAYPPYYPPYPPGGPYPPFWPGAAYPPMPLTVPRQRDALAITSLVLALGAVTFPPAAPAAVGLGLAALARIRQTGRLGRNFAITGIALGTLGTLIFIALLLPVLANG